MTSPGVDPDEPDHPAIVRIKEMLARGDLDKLDRMIKWQDSLEALGKLGMLMQWIVVKLAVGVAWAAGLLASYGVLTGELQKWLTQR